MALTVVWFRNDLRLADHAPLTAAAHRGAVMPVFILDPDEPLGAASRWWLHQSLAKLLRSLARRGGRLILRCGKPHRILPDLVAQSGADAVYWQRRYEPAIAARDRKVAKVLDGRACTFAGGLLREPWDVQTKQGGPYQVFTPFWRAHQQLPHAGRPLDVPKLSWPEQWPHTEGLGRLELMPKIAWYGGLAETWTPGEAGAAERLQCFTNHRLDDYAQDRELPGIDGTSMLSPHLHFGEISPRQVLHATRHSVAFVRELGWREFAHHVLHHFPHTPTQPLREPFARFPWRRDRKALRAWQQGRTGYPLVDAAMRQLWHTGWMHNRARMVVASFLVKDLLIRWRQGADWFADTLVDADLANNTLNWQWAGGCGADAAPYFRIFNPTTQARRFDPDGTYIRRWVPELRDTPAATIHEPYGKPIIDHAVARDRALAALARIRT